MSVRIRSLHRSLVCSFCAFLSVAVAAPAATVSAEEPPDCTEELQQIPRDGSTMQVSNPWLTYSGNIPYSAVHDAGADAVELQNIQDDTTVGEVELEQMEADAHVGVRLEGAGDTVFRWNIADAPAAEVAVGHEAAPDTQPPEMGDGEVEVDLELIVYDDFPVLFRSWSVSFPRGDDEETEPENMRYLLEFHPEGEDESTDRVLVAPDVLDARDDQLHIELGDRPERCQHAEPSIPVTDEATVSVYAVDVAGNRSEQPVEGLFEGVEEQKLAEAHEEMNEIIEQIEQEADEDAETTEQIAERIEARDGEPQQDDDEESGQGCTTAGGSVGAPAAVLLVLLFVFVARGRRSVYTAIGATHSPRGGG